MMKKMTTDQLNLQSIFDFQKKFQAMLHGIELPCSNDLLVSEYALGIFTELGEALAVNKNWKKWTGSKPFETQALREEIADIWLFLINYTMANNMDVPEILHEIVRKQKILEQRKAEGYYEQN